MAKTATRHHAFDWIGTNRDGERMQGRTVGSTPAAVKVALRQQGIRPLRVRRQTTLFGRGSGNRRRPLRVADIALFARQLATMLGAGVSLVQTLGIIAKGSDHPALAEMVTTIRNRIESGATLAEALARHDRHFDSLFVNLVAAGEASGTLDTQLAKIATHKEKTEAIKAKVRKALTYPGAVVVAAGMVMGVLLYFVVPQFQVLFRGFDAELPIFTQWVIQLSAIIRHGWWLIVAVLILSTFGFVRARRRFHAFRRLIDRLLLKLPFIGSILRKAAIARFARTLATMLAAGMPLVEALDAVAGTAGNLVFARAIRQIRSQVETGQQLQLAVTNTGVFTSMAQQMLAIGEESGSLDTMCARIADIYEQQVDNQTEALSTLLEPLIMAVIGILVGGLIIAMYLPIFQLGSVF